MLNLHWHIFKYRLSQYSDYYLCVSFKLTPSFQLNCVKKYVCFARILLLLFFLKERKIKSKPANSSS